MHVEKYLQRFLKKSTHDVDGFVILVIVSEAICWLYHEVILMVVYWSGFDGVEIFRGL